MSPLTESTRLTLAKQSVAATDTNIREVSLLLHGNGINGSATITDSSLMPKTVTPLGTTQISTGGINRVAFGNSSLFFNNSPANAITTLSNADFAFGTSDFTVEAWIYQKTQSLYATLLEIGSHAFTTGIGFFTGSDGFYVYSGAYAGTRVNTLSLNVWQHVAYCRSGSIMRMFLNGMLQSSGTLAQNLTTTSNVSIGYPVGQVPLQNQTIYQFDGYIDDLRITKGVARYTSNFTPPTLPFPDF
jgi:hypothetical protein